MKLIAATWQDVPKQVQLFLRRALIIFVLWKLLYHLLLFPSRLPDRELTRLTAVSSEFLYKELLNESKVISREELKRGIPMAVLYVQNNRAIGIADSCNGLELYVLFIAFLFCIPTTVKRQLVFTVVGTMVIFMCNGFRCFGLAWLFLHNYSWANFAHHYLFKMVIYALIFWGWTLYVRKFFLYGH